MIKKLIKITREINEILEQTKKVINELLSWNKDLLREA